MDRDDEIRRVSKANVERHKKIKIDEKNRVNLLIVKDNSEAARESMRQQAELEISEGKFVNLSDAVVEPTDEWKRHHESRPYSPPARNGTVRDAKTVRRVITPTVLKLYRDGRATEDQYRACAWYRDQYEAAGMDGCYVTTSFSDTGGGGGPSMRGHLAATERQAEAKRLWRAARDAIHPEFIQFFDLIVLRDYTPRNASKFVRVSERRADSHFRGLCEDLIDLIDSLGIELRTHSNEDE